MAVFFLSAALIGYDFLLSVGYHQSSSGYDSSSNSGNGSTNNTNNGGNNNGVNGKRLNKHHVKNDAVSGMHSKSKSSSLYQ